jgi:hypothetical protein
MNDMMATDLSVGTRIYRPARLEATAGGRRLVLENPSMQDFGDGTIMLRARFVAAAGAPDWRVVPWEEPGGRVCVCDEPIPADWTYFEVLFADVNFVAVSPVAGDQEELRRVAEA